MSKEKESNLQVASGNTYTTQLKGSQVSVEDNDEETCIEKIIYYLNDNQGRIRNERLIYYTSVVCVEVWRK